LLPFGCVNNGQHARLFRGSIEVRTLAPQPFFNKKRQVILWNIHISKKSW
jgi:hypothetical protein